jgi:hypothetical protein
VVLGDVRFTTRAHALGVLSVEVTAVTLEHVPVYPREVWLVYVSYTPVSLCLVYPSPVSVTVHGCTAV